MLINRSERPVTTHVEFVSYTGKYPELCQGLLTLKIDGKKHTFGNDQMHKEAQHPKFWTPCQNCGEKSTMKGEWYVDVDMLPDSFRKYAAEIDNIFNTNVDQSCCR